MGGVRRAITQNDTDALSSTDAETWQCLLMSKGFRKSDLTVIYTVIYTLIHLPSIIREKERWRHLVTTDLQSCFLTMSELQCQLSSGARAPIGFCAASISMKSPAMVNFNITNSFSHDWLQLENWTVCWVPRIPWSGSWRRSAANWGPNWRSWRETAGPYFPCHSFITFLFCLNISFTLFCFHFLSLAHCLPSETVGYILSH